MSDAPCKIDQCFVLAMGDTALCEKTDNVVNLYEEGLKGGYLREASCCLTLKTALRHMIASTADRRSNIDRDYGEGDAAFFGRLFSEVCSEGVEFKFVRGGAALAKLLKLEDVCELPQLQYCNLTLFRGVGERVREPDFWYGYSCDDAALEVQTLYDLWAETIIERLERKQLCGYGEKCSVVDLVDRFSEPFNVKEYNFAKFSAVDVTERKALVSQQWKLCWMCQGDGSQAYMLHDELWKKVVPVEFQKGVICVSCLQKCMGRPLELTDLTACNLNKSILLGYEIGRRTLAK